MPSLIYIADPMCAWCYGFEPELTALLKGLPELHLHIVLGGLRPYQADPMDEETNAAFISDLKKVHDASGLPIADAFLTPDHLPYDTEPACRAVATVRRIAPEAQWPMLQAIQQAFFAEGRKATQGDVLADIGAAVLRQSGREIDVEAFHAKWMEQESVESAAADFMQVRQWGISGFPTLVLEREGRLDLVTSGFMRTEQLVERMQAIVDETLELQQ